MLKARIPLASLAEENGISYDSENDQEHSELNNRYVSLNLFTFYNSIEVLMKLYIELKVRGVSGFAT